MLTTIAVIVVILLVSVGAVLIYAATKPDTFRVQRAIGINAPPEKIFPFLNDFRRWSAWSPWEKLDPELKRTHSGAESGPGAVYAWEGNRKVGAGRMEITDAPPPSRVAIKLDFIRPFEAHNTAEFTLEPKGDLTTVTWTMHGRNIFFGKVMSVFLDMDKMVGKDFETGLANLKAAAEQ
jgi:uncharacterized protein YndB with AHSA1/START domain